MTSSSDGRFNPAVEDATVLLGRILLSVIFIWGGYGKLMSAAATTAYFAKIGLPAPGIAYYVAVAVELIGGLMMLVGVLTRPVALLLAVWCIATALAAHTNFADRNMEIHFMKNLAMTGGFLYAAVLGAGRYGIDAWITHRPDPRLASSRP